MPVIDGKQPFGKKGNDGKRYRRANRSVYHRSISLLQRLSKFDRK